MLPIFHALKYILKWPKASKASPNHVDFAAFPLETRSPTECVDFTPMLDAKYPKTSTEAFGAMNTWLKSFPLDDAFLWRITGSTLAVLFYQAKYEVYSQCEGLLSLLHSITTCSGHRPPPDGQCPTWRSSMTDVVTPTKYSWSWKSSQGQPTV